MDAALAQFLENTNRAKTISGLAEALTKLGVGFDVTDLHRAAIVLAVSALDHFVHDVVRIGVVKSYTSTIPTTEATLAFKVPLSSVLECVKLPGDLTWLDSAVRSAHSFQTFQHPDKIADAIRLISPVKLWEEVGKEIGMTAKEVKTHLTAIVDRRNKIAHEADMDHLGTGARWPIDETLVNDALAFIEKVVRAISKVADEEKKAAAVILPTGP